MKNEALRPRFKCFHNGIILIVNCLLSCAAKVQLFWITQEFFGIFFVFLMGNYQR